jgi:hypothetical protein
MKYLKKFNEEAKEKSIEDLCKKYNIIDYDITMDDLVNVYENVDISGRGLTKIPIQFGKLGGCFNCHNNQLKTLEGSPKKVSGYFDCSTNRLPSLEGSPRQVGGSFYCGNNQLTSLEGCPKDVSVHFYCHYNFLTTLEGCPEKVGGLFNCTDNPIYGVYKLFGTLERYKASMDYKYLRGTDIVRGRFKKACEDAEIKMPKYIKGYKYIDL